MAQVTGIKNINDRTGQTCSNVATHLANMKHTCSLHNSEDVQPTLTHNSTCIYNTIPAYNTIHVGLHPQAQVTPAMLQPLLALTHIATIKIITNGTCAATHQLRVVINQNDNFRHNELTHR